MNLHIPSKVKHIAKQMFKLYVAWAIIADLIMISGILYIIFF